MKVVYAAGFVLMTLFGAYYYQDILFQPPGDRSGVSTATKPPSQPVTATIDRKFSVKGMYCDSCRVKIESAVKKIPGVQSVNLNLETGEMIVSYDQSNESVQQTMSVVKELGYTPGLKSKSGKLQVMDFNVTFK